MDSSFISFENVSLTYPGGTEALRNGSFNVGRGEFVALVGPSGSGKSSLLRLAGGLIVPSEGRVLLAGKPVTQPHAQAGYVFQDPVLLPWRDALANVALPLEVQGVSRAEREARAMTLLEQQGLAEFAKAYPDELSGGMQQKVAIARALAYDPNILLMDEPFSALDAISRELLNMELLRIWSECGKTILFVTHTISEAVFLADRVVILGPRPGHIIGEIKIDLPRPRTLETMELPDFAKTSARIRAMLLEVMDLPEMRMPACGDDKEKPDAA